LGATVSGLPQTGRQIPIQGRGIIGSPIHHGGGGGVARGGHARTIVVPYGYPVYYGCGYDGFADYYRGGQQMTRPVESSPSIIINQYFTPALVRPQMRDYPDLPEPVKPPQEPQSSLRENRREEKKVDPQEAAQAHTATITLLAFSDSSVVAVIAYWQE